MSMMSKSTSSSDMVMDLKRKERWTNPLLFPDHSPQTLSLLEVIIPLFREISRFFECVVYKFDSPRAGRSFCSGENRGDRDLSIACTIYRSFHRLHHPSLLRQLPDKIEMLHSVSIISPLNGTILSSILILTFAKNGKSPDLFLEKPGKFLQKSKSKSKNRRTHAALSLANFSPV